MSSPTVVQEVVFIGAESAGKSLLVKNLVRYFADAKLDGNGDAMDLEAFCAQTVGVDIVDLTINERKVQFRELGSAIVSRWHSYYEACTLLVFVVDLSDISNWSTAFIALLEASQYRNSLLKGKHVLLLLNRVDEIDKGTYQAGLQSLQLPNFNTSWPELEIIDASPSQPGGLDAVARWLKGYILPR